MSKIIRNISVAALPVMFGAQALWAQSAAGTAAVNGGGAGGSGPVWSGYGPGPWMMGGWGGPGMMGYGGWNNGGWMMMLLGMVIFVALLVFLFRAVAWNGCAHRGVYQPHPPQPGRSSSGLHALDERYARGEINREEYLQKKQDILGDSATFQNRG